MRVAPRVAVLLTKTIISYKQLIIDWLVQCVDYLFQTSFRANLFILWAQTDKEEELENAVSS